MPDMHRTLRKSYICDPPELGDNPSLRKLVSHYIKYCRAEARQELDDFRKEPSLSSAIERAARAQDVNGRRFGHQRLIQRTSIAKAPSAFGSAAKILKRSKTFDELYTVAHSLAKGVGGLGELYVYDFALRIGAYLGLAPTLVYLHAGTRVGAKMLGMNVSRPTIPQSEFPPEMQRLSADEVENFLCTYRRYFKIESNEDR